MLGISMIGASEMMNFGVRWVQVQAALPAPRVCVFVCSYVCVCVCVCVVCCVLCVVCCVLCVVWCMLCSDLVAVFVK